MSWKPATRNRFKRNIPKLDFSSVEWKKFLGNAKDQPFDEYRMLKLALVLGFWWRHLH